MYVVQSKVHKDIDSSITSNDKTEYELSSEGPIREVALLASQQRDFSWNVEFAFSFQLVNEAKSWC